MKTDVLYRIARTIIYQCLCHKVRAFQDRNLILKFSVGREDPGADNQMFLYPFYHALYIHFW